MNVEIGTGAAQFLEKEYINEIFVAVSVKIFEFYKSHDQVSLKFKKVGYKLL
jgi:hypothetical protein